MIRVRADSIGHRGGRWRSGRLVRVDFDRVVELAGHGEAEVGREKEELGSRGKRQWTLPRDHRRVVFLLGSGEVDIWGGGGEIILAAEEKDISLDAGAGENKGRTYTSSNFDAIVEMARDGKLSPTPSLRISQDETFQSFTDDRLGEEDWRRLGFSPPRGERPALDGFGGTKFGDGRYICLPHSVIDQAQAACSSLWDHFIDSCQIGVYFSKLVVSKTVHTGPCAGWPAGSTLLPHPEFLSGVPYRNASHKLQTSREGNGGLASAVWHKGAQYLSFDPLAAEGGAEIQARWRTPSGWESGIFGERGKYVSAHEIRRTHYVPPRTKTVRFWANGAASPEQFPCVLSPQGGAKYKARPDPGERKRLVSRYGKAAVPLNFNKYTEGQIAKKSELVRRVEDGGWVYIPAGEDGESFVKQGYSNMGEGEGIAWTILRQIAMPGDIERDPVGGGSYVRLPSRGEVFKGDYLRGLLRLLERGGWGFLVKEMAADPGRLQKSLLTIAVC